MKIKKSAVVFSILSVIVITLFLLWPKSKKKEISYTEIKPEISTLRIAVTSTGTVQPQGRIEMKPPVPGRMESVLVREGQKVRRGQILAWMSSTERAALLDSARAVSSEEYKRFQEYYRATPIMAPVSGTIILRSVEPGQTVASADVLLVISDRLEVVAKVDETDIARIQKGIPAEIILDAYPDKPIEASVLAIAFEAKTVNNVTTYDVEVYPKTQPAFMRSGMTANVTFILKKKTDVLTLPLSAIQFNKEAPFVTERIGKDKTQNIEIQIGESDGIKTEIVSGLDENSTVLIPKIQTQVDGGTNPFMPSRKRKDSSSGKKSTH